MALYLASNCFEYRGIGDCDNVEEAIPSTIIALMRLFVILVVEEKSTRLKSKSTDLQGGDEIR